MNDESAVEKLVKGLDAEICSVESMTAEAIAAVIYDLRTKNVQAINSDPKVIENSAGLLELMQKYGAPVVDATALYRSLLGREGVAMYEDHNIMPVFDLSFITYVNEHGNVVVSATCTTDSEPGKQRWEGANEDCDWERVTHVVNTYVYCGGRGGNGPVNTGGPMHAWNIAAYGDGEIADIHWIQLLESDQQWDMALLVLLGTLTFFGARNVELAEPVRSRGERKRLARAAPGVTIKELVVFPAGKSTRSKSGQVLSGGAPLTSVRGHYAKYGIDGRGLLFGKIAGRFWIPSHARGDAEHGESRHNYRLEV